MITVQKLMEIAASCGDQICIKTAKDILDLIEKQPQKRAAPGPRLYATKAPMGTGYLWHEDRNPGLVYEFFGDIQDVQELTRPVRRSEFVQLMKSEGRTWQVVDDLAYRIEKWGFANEP